MDNMLISTIPPKKAQRLGSTLRMKRKSLKKTLEQLEDTEISTSTMSNIERGVTNVSWGKIVIYARKLGYSNKEIPNLLEDEEDQQLLLLEKLKIIESRIDLVGPDDALEKLEKLDIISSNPINANIEYLKGRCFLSKKRWGKARTHFKNALNIMKHFPDFFNTNLKAGCHKDLARTYYFLENDLLKALEHVKLGLNSIVNEEENQIKFSLLIGKVIYLNLLNQDTETVKKTIDELWEQKNEIDSVDATISLYEARATILNKMELYEQAMKSALEGMYLAKKNNNLDRALELLTTYSAICINKEDYAQAEEHLQLALDMRPIIKKKYQKEYLLVTTLTKLGQLYILQNRNEDAQKVLTNAVVLGRKTKSKEVLRYFTALVALGDCFLIQDKFQEAITPFTQALEITQLHSRSGKHRLWSKNEHDLWIKLGICFEKSDKGKLKECMEKSFRFNVQYIMKGVKS